ncbi:MAG: L-lactate dehydrogenase [Pirellulales bacterium]|nr:L-lactate dehydrogenase [Pirellulales bacterium]
MTSSSITARRKVVVVGTGAVGSTFCFALAQSGLADEIVLIDHNADLARGQALDLAHGQPFFPTVSIRVGDAADYGDARVVVVTAGTAQRPGESRLDLLQRNAAIVGRISSEVAEKNSPAVLVIVSNPVDAITHVALRHTGWERGRVIGSGTVLDSARFRYLLSRHCGIDTHNVHAYVLGEHGDSELAAWSMTHVAGMTIDEYCPVCGRCEDWLAERARIEQEIRDSAYHIIGYKGATCFGVGMALVRIVGAILRDEHGVLTVSTRLDGEFGLTDVCLSVPCIVAAGGAERIIEARLPDNELKALLASAALLKEAISQLEGQV